jgi:cell division protease FtsH
MEEQLCPVAFDTDRPTFLTGPGAEQWRQQRYSDETARAIDLAVQHIVEGAFARAVEIVRRERATLDRGAKLLLEKETLDEAQLGKILETVKATEPALTA